MGLGSGAYDGLTDHTVTTTPPGPSQGFPPTSQKLLCHQGSQPCPGQEETVGGRELLYFIHKGRPPQESWTKATFSRTWVSHHCSL